MVLLIFYTTCTISFCTALVSFRLVLSSLSKVLTTLVAEARREAVGVSKVGTAKFLLMSLGVTVKTLYSSAENVGSRSSSSMPRDLFGSHGSGSGTRLSYVSVGLIGTYIFIHG